MAAITGAAIAAGTTAYSIGKSIKEGKERKAAARAIDNLKSPELQNVADDLQVSTRGSDLRREEQARNSAGQIQAAREAGTRGIIGSVGKIAAENQRVNAENAADLDRQQKEIDTFRAEDNANIRGLNEQRFREKLAALSSQYNASNQSQQQAIGNAIQGTGMLTNALGNMNFGGTTGKTGTTNYGTGTVTPSYSNPIGKANLGSVTPTNNGINNNAGYLHNLYKSGVTIPAFNKK